MTNFDHWKILVGDRQQRTWSGKDYQFYIGTNHQEEMRVIDSLQSQTPIRNFLQAANEDVVIRAIAFLSYYNINPTFNNQGDDIGTGFFWFPLDYLDDDTYCSLSDKIGSEDEGEEEENEDQDGDAALPDFPVMSTVSEPVIDAAVSDSYTSKIDRVSVDKRKEKLEEEIKERKKQKVEEFEEWLEEGMANDPYPRNLSVFAEVVGRLPAVILLSLINEERDRIENIYEVFSNIGVDEAEEYSDGPEFLLQKLNELTDEYPAFDSPAIEAFCLDGYGRNCDYHVTKSRGRKIEEQLSSCENCGSDLFRIYRTGLDERVKDAWMMGLLPELVVARILMGADWTKEVLPHRMVQMEQEDGTMSPGVEMDICVQTKNDEVIFVEVTSQTNALSRVMKKKEKLNKNGIHYDALVQIAPIANDEMVPFDNKVVSVAGWMIRGLETDGFRESLYKKVENLSWKD